LSAEAFRVGAGAGNELADVVTPIGRLQRSPDHFCFYDGERPLLGVLSEKIYAAYDLRNSQALRGFANRPAGGMADKS
jgi:hypothetical protein